MFFCLFFYSFSYSFIKYRFLVASWLKHCTSYFFEHNFSEHPQIICECFSPPHFPSTDSAYMVRQRRSFTWKTTDLSDRLQSVFLCSYNPIPPNDLLLKKKKINGFVHRKSHISLNFNNEIILRVSTVYHREKELITNESECKYVRACVYVCVRMCVCVGVCGVPWIHQTIKTFKAILYHMNL